MMRFAAALAFVTAALPSPVSACSYSQIPEEVGDSSAQFLAREMVCAATYVDLVLLRADPGVPAHNASACRKPSGGWSISFTKLSGWSHASFPFELKVAAVVVQQAHSVTLESNSEQPAVEHL